MFDYLPSVGRGGRMSPLTVGTIRGATWQLASPGKPTVGETELSATGVTWHARHGISA